MVSKIFPRSLTELPRNSFQLSAYHRQYFYLRYHLYIGIKFGVHEFMAGLHEVNTCIPYLFSEEDEENARQS